MPTSRAPSAARRQGRPPGAGANPIRLFAFAVPGLASQVAGELAAIPSVQVHDSGFDGRSDVVLFTAEAPALPDVLSVRLAEDVFVEAGRTLRSDGDRPAWIASRLWRPQPAGRALAARARMVRPPRIRATFRVITRVLQERSFLRTELRREVSSAVQRQQPQWRFADPAEVEVWVVEYQPGRIIAGLRATDVRMRQHDGRRSERRGALRPTVAAAMVRLAGTAGETLLDPCCGSGTILVEARHAGWRTHGLDIAPEAIQVARRNANRALLYLGDARQLPFAGASMDACVSNLPFGHQYGVQGGLDEWLHAVLAELCRVTRPGGRIVLLAPRISRSTVPRQLTPTDRVQVRLLGRRTTIYAFDRR